MRSAKSLIFSKKGLISMEVPERWRHQKFKSRILHQHAIVFTGKMSAGYRQVNRLQFDRLPESTSQACCTPEHER